MPQIVPAGSINLAALQDPDLYLQVLNPPPFLRGAPTDIVGVVGTASWGPVNRPVQMGSGQDATLAFGSMSSASLLDQFDIATDLFLAFGQAQSTATLGGWGVRVTDGTDQAASIGLVGAATTTPSIATIGGTITVGDTLTLIATSTALTGSPIQVTYTVKAGDTTTTIATALAAAVNTQPVLVAAGVYASSTNAVITLYWPSTTSPTIVWSSGVTGAATETIIFSTGVAATSGGTASALYTGILGAQVKVTVAASVGIANNYNVTVSGFQGTAELYQNISGTNFWRNLQTALASGQGSYRGASRWLRLTIINAAVGVPTAGTYSLAGGRDGRTGVTTSMLLGSSTATPNTGIWALGNVNPSVSIAWITGLTDTSAVATVDSFALVNGVATLFPFSTGTSTTVAAAAVSTNGVAGPEFTYVKDSIYFLDTYNNQRRLVFPTAVIAGLWATQAPQNSPLNKQVQLVLGTERNDPVNGTIPYSPTEIGTLNSAGIMIISNPCPGGSYFGVRTAASTSPLPATQPVEWWRLTMFIARTLEGAGGLGQFIGQLQSQQPGDELRMNVKMLLNSFAETLANANVIDSGIGFCEYSSSGSANFGNGMNTPSSVAQHYLYALFRATYLSSIWYFICSIQGGTTVVTVAPGQA